MKKIDMHVHSEYSYDSEMNLKKMAKVVKKRKLDGIALTDHNTFAGVKKAKEIFKEQNLIVVPGVELRNNRTDYLIYFIEDEKILKMKNTFDIIDYAHDNGALVGIAHPYRRGYRLPEPEIIEKLDLIEIFNAKNKREYDEKAKKLKEKYKKTPTGGSDAHIYSYLGLGYTMMGLDDVYDSLLKKNVTVIGDYPSKLLRLRNMSSSLKYMPTERKRYYLIHPLIVLRKIL